MAKQSFFDGLRRFRGIVLPVLILFATAMPAVAGTVYVPWTSSWTSEGVELVTTVRITNLSDEPRSYTGLFLPAGVDGLSIEDEPVPRTLAPFETQVFIGDALEFIAPVGEWGLLEIVADEDVQVVAHIRGSGSNAERLGVDLPVASSGNQTPAGAIGVLQGLVRNEEKVLTDLMAVNLSGEQASCQVEVRQRTGELDGAVDFQVLPLSLHVHTDLLGAVGLTSVVERSLFVDCDQDTFLFTVRRDLRNGETVVATAPGMSTLIPPPRGDQPEFMCPEGTIFERVGSFHTATPGDETAKFKVFQPGLQFSRVEIEMDFTHGGWDREAPDGNHAIFWWHRGQENHWAGNVFGYLNAFGPPKDLVRLGTNITHDISPQLSKSALFVPGETYHVSYVYDASISLIRATVTDQDGAQVVQVTDDRTPDVINTGDLGMFLIFGHPAINAGPEVPTYDWTYANLCVVAE